MTRLLEMCCYCGFVHRDDRIAYRAYKPHYHWHPPRGEKIIQNVLLHATICAACTKEVDWGLIGAVYKEFEKAVNFHLFLAQKRSTPAAYRVAGSWNAPLPTWMEPKASKLYEMQAFAFEEHAAMDGGRQDFEDVSVTSAADAAAKHAVDDAVRELTAANAPVAPSFDLHD